MVTPSLLEAAFFNIFEAFARLTFSSLSRLMAKIWSPVRMRPSFLMAPFTDFTSMLLVLLSCVRARPVGHECGVEYAYIYTCAMYTSWPTCLTPYHPLYSISALERCTHRRLAYIYIYVRGAVMAFKKVHVETFGIRSVIPYTDSPRHSVH